MSVFIRLERGSERTLHTQLVEQMRRAIRTGRLSAGERLPATRALAADLGISRNVVMAAFDELTSEGYLEGRVGSGTYVARGLTVPPERIAAVPARAHRWLRDDTPDVDASPPGVRGGIDFRLGTPAIAPLPVAAWREAWRVATRDLPPTVYGPMGGDPALRAAIAGYLGRARGMACGAADILVTAGAAQALELIARVTLTPGDVVAMEEPGYPEARAILRERGASIVPVPVDGDGLRVDALPTGPDAPLLAYATPSHQYPLGPRLPVARRIALIEWAIAHDALIVEDDYDSEFRFDAPPLPALAGLDERGHVAYIGTFSKVLAPSLRAGYLVAPPALRAQIERRTEPTARAAPWPMQRALAHLLTSGDLERHIRRMRRHYAVKRAALHDALVPVAPYARLEGLEAGLHACLVLRGDLDEQIVVRRAAARGISVYPLAPYFVGTPNRRGILLGYGGLELPDLVRGACILAEVISALARESDVA